MNLPTAAPSEISATGEEYLIVTTLEGKTRKIKVKNLPSVGGLVLNENGELEVILHLLPVTGNTPASNTLGWHEDGYPVYGDGQTFEGVPLGGARRVVHTLSEDVTYPADGGVQAFPDISLVAGASYKISICLMGKLVGAGIESSQGSIILGHAATTALALNGVAVRDIGPGSPTRQVFSVSTLGSGSTITSTNPTLMMPYSLYDGDIAVTANGVCRGSMADILQISAKGDSYASAPLTLYAGSHVELLRIS